MKLFQRLLVAAPAAALLPTVLAPISGLANEFHLNLDGVQEYSISQGATIRDFSDVYPTDWAYQALAELVETYGCVGGYPDGTFRGQQPITRFEVAAILSKCLDAISAKMAMMEGGDDASMMEDKGDLDRLVASFEEELITLKGTVDGMDAKVSELEENQFSTTTKAEFEIATDFVYFSSDDEEARRMIMVPEVTREESYTHTLIPARPGSPAVPPTSQTIVLVPAMPGTPQQTEMLYAYGMSAVTEGSAPSWHHYLNPGQMYSDFVQASGESTDSFITATTTPQDLYGLSDYLLVKIDDMGNYVDPTPPDADNDNSMVDIVTVSSLLVTDTNNNNVLVPSDDLGDMEMAVLVERPTHMVWFYNDDDMADTDAGPTITLGSGDEEYLNDLVIVPQALLDDDGNFNDSATGVSSAETATAIQIEVPKTRHQIDTKLNDTADPLMLTQVEIVTQEAQPATPAQTTTIISDPGSPAVPDQPAVTETRTRTVVVEEESEVPLTDDNSGIAMSTSVKIAFETSFTGSDKLTFSLKGDVISMTDHYLVMGNFYDVADSGGTDVEFSGFAYETSFDMSGLMGNLVFGTDVDDFDPIEGMDVYYGGGGYDGYGPSDFGDAGIGVNMELISGAAGTMTASAAYAVDADDASNQSGEHGVFGKETDRSGVLALNWSGALLGGNEAMFTVAYQDIKMMEMMSGMMDSMEMSKNYWHLFAGAYITDTISFSGSYSLGKLDTKDDGMDENDTVQWMFGAQIDDAIIPGNSAGIAYGTPEYMKDDDDSTKVLEVFYSFSINDNFEVPIYLDFISNINNMDDTNALGLAIRPTLSF